MPIHRRIRSAQRSSTTRTAESTVRAGSGPPFFTRLAIVAG
jgi:hypothetical protein